MRLPNILKEAIEEKIAGLSARKLAIFSKILSDRYRENKKNKGLFISSEEDHFAYLVARLPATYGAIFNVLSQVKEKVDSIESFLDIGTGPGTGFWAAQEIFNLKLATLVEKEKDLIVLGKSFTDRSNKIRCNWIQKNLELGSDFITHDLTLMAYSLGELSIHSRKLVIRNLWEASDKVLVLIEPGTPAGFSRILEARTWLNSWGAHLLAPCPHQNRCPLAETDWCHFSERIERSSLHRLAKRAELNYEDEKFSYVIFTRKLFLKEGSRVIRSPQKRPGHVEIKFCSSHGIENKIISRKQKDIYSTARKLKWGSLFNLNRNTL